MKGGKRVAARQTVGILLPAPVLRNLRLKRPTWEAALKYVEGARAFDLEAVLFSLDGYNPRSKTVQGYVRRLGAWRPWRGPVPAVVHNRTLPRTPRAIRLLRHLDAELKGGMFNPVLSRDKWIVWKQLWEHEALKPHLPPTWPLLPAVWERLPLLVARYGSVVIKPRFGGRGQGVIFIRPAAGQSNLYRWIPARGRSRSLRPSGLVRMARLLSRRRNYIVQAALPLVTYQGGRCDLRIPIQRNGQGEWQVLPGTLKRAVRNRFVTNIAQGAKAYPYEVAVTAIFGAEGANRIWQDIQQLSLLVARHLSGFHPRLADLGLDIGLDASGKPWIIEVNFRDQRLCSLKARQWDTHTRLYHNPMAYARHLLDLRTKEASA